MNTPKTKIVVIHDGLDPDDDPLLVELKIKYGEGQVEYFENSNMGLEYVLENLNQKMVVLLDVNFSNGEKSGIQVFEEIREQTSLVYIILVTANDLHTISNNDLILLVNHDAFAIESVASDYEKLILLVEKATHELDVRVASVIEQWINSRSEEEVEKPYIMTEGGKEYTLSDILHEIRQKSSLGTKMERNILLLAIDLLTRGKEKVND